MNEQKFASFSPEIQEALLQAGQEAAEFVNEQWQSQASDLLADLEEAGMTVVEPTPPASGR
jgi:TRAP-type C4-dicarboxylate transport system substrate-binding protein